MNEKVRRITVRIADVTYTLVSIEPEAAIQRAVDAAERLVDSVRAANPSLNLSSSTVLALLNATGDRERVADELHVAESRISDLEAKQAGLRREIAGLKEQNSILVQEIRRSRAHSTVQPPSGPVLDVPVSGRTEPPDVPTVMTPTRHTAGNITFVLDPRIAELESESPSEPESPPEPEIPSESEAPAEREDPVFVEETDLPEDESLPTAEDAKRFIQTGFEDLFTDE